MNKPCYKNQERRIQIKQSFGMSNKGNLREAISGLKSPEAMLLLSNAEQFEEHVA